MEQNELRKIIEQVISEMNITDIKDTKFESAPKANAEVHINSGEMVPDITEVILKEQYLVPEPVNGPAYLAIKEHTPARVGIWRAGHRYTTATSLRFRADHAAAQDAVFSNVSEEFIDKMGLFTVESLCKDKNEYVTRPDLGKKLTEDGINTVKEKCKRSPVVQILVADGLSSSAVEANTQDILPSLMQSLKSLNIDCGTPFFVKLGRVGIMDVVSEVLDAEVTCLLIGERPGLVTAESMSAYIAYRAKVDMPEARRTVVSNIHKGGTIPVEAGAHIADVIKIMLDKKASGTDLKL